MVCNLKQNFETLRHSPQDMDLYAEWDTEETIQAVETALARHHRVTRVVANDLPAAFLQLQRLRPDLAFNMAEGLGGVSRESHVPSLLDILGIPYTGSDPLTLALCLDKARCKEVLSYHRIATPRFRVVETPADDGALEGFPLPAIVKPLHEGSSKGVTDDCVVREPEALRRKVHHVLGTYGQPALVEEFLTGREFTVAILGNGDGVQVLPIVEILFDGLPQGVNPIYSFEAKWVWDTPDRPLDVFRCPAQLDEDVAAEVAAVARRAFRALQCRDWCRVDVRLDAAGRPNVIELNPLPGILPRPEDNSCFPKAARCAGLSYPDLVNRVVEEAWARHGRN